MKKTILSFFVLLFILVSSSFAQEGEKKWVSGNSFNVIIPQGDLAKEYNYGLGVYGNIDYNFNEHFAWRFDLGWNDLEGDERTIVDTTGYVHTHKPKISVWEFTTGLKASFSVFYIEARGGYFTGINEWGIIPAVGLRLGKFDINGSYKLLGDNNWVAARIGYYWGQ